MEIETALQVCPSDDTFIKTGDEISKLLCFTESKYEHFTLSVAFATLQFCCKVHVGGSVYRDKNQTLDFTVSSQEVTILTTLF